MVWQAELEKKLEKAENNKSLCLTIENGILYILENGDDHPIKINKNLIDKIFEALNQSFVDNYWSCCNSCLRFIWTLIQNNNLKYNEIDEKNVKILLNVYYSMISISKKNQVVELEFATMLRNIVGFFMSWVDEYYLLNNKLSFDETDKNYLIQHIPIFMKDKIMLKKYIFSLFDLFKLTEPKRSNCNDVLEYLFIGHSYILSSRYAAETYTMIQQMNIQKHNIKLDSTKLVECVNRFLYCPDFELQLILGELIWRMLKKIDFGIGMSQKKAIDKEYIEFVNSFRSSWPEGLIQLRYIRGENFDYSFRGLLTPWNKTCNGNGMNIWSLSGIQISMNILDLKLTTDIDICAFSITFNSDIDEYDYIKLKNSVINDENTSNTFNSEKELKPHISSAEIPYWTIKSVLYNEIENELNINIVFNELLEIKQSWTGLFASNIEKSTNKKNELLKINLYLDEDQANHIMRLFKASRIEKIYGMKEIETPSRKVSIADSRAISISQSNIINDQFNIIESVEPSGINFENIKMSIATTKNFQNESVDDSDENKDFKASHENKVRRVSFVTSKECRQNDIKSRNNREINKNISITKNKENKDKKKKIEESIQKNKADIIIIGLLNEQKKLTQEMEERNNSKSNLNDEIKELKNKSKTKSIELIENSTDEKINLKNNESNNENHKEDLKLAKTNGSTSNKKKNLSSNKCKSKAQSDYIKYKTSNLESIKDKKADNNIDLSVQNVNNVFNVNDTVKDGLKKENKESPGKRIKKKINKKGNNKLINNSNEDNKVNNNNNNNIENGENNEINENNHSHNVHNNEIIHETEQLDNLINDMYELKEKESKLDTVMNGETNKIEIKTIDNTLCGLNSKTIIEKEVKIPDYSLSRLNSRVSCLKRGRIRKKDDEYNYEYKKFKQNQCEKNILTESLNCNKNNYNEMNSNNSININSSKNTKLKGIKNKTIDKAFLEENIEQTPIKLKNNVRNSSSIVKTDDNINFGDKNNTNKEKTITTIDQTTCPTKVDNGENNVKILNNNIEEKKQMETIVPKEIAVTDNNYPILEEYNQINDLENKKRKYLSDTRSEKLFKKWYNEINCENNIITENSDGIKTPEILKTKRKQRMKKKSMAKIDKETMKLQGNNSNDKKETSNIPFKEKDRVENEQLNESEFENMCDDNISEYTEEHTNVEIGYDNKYSLSSLEKLIIDDNNTMLYSPDQFDDSITLTNYSLMTKLDSANGTIENLPSELRISNTKLEEKKNIDNMIYKLEELNKKLLIKCNKEVENYFIQVKKYIENMWSIKLDKFKERRRELNIRIEKNRINIQNEYEDLNNKYTQIFEELFNEINKEKTKLKEITSIDEVDNENNVCVYLNILLEMKNVLEKEKKLMDINIEKLMERREFEKNKYESKSKSSKLNLRQLLKRMMTSDD
ncbi:hypothetical protein FG386_001066 [Cryptosporidium ryanae]|uniref:uncharacterized protein n=1 Tax=Cryptosporidium ryanae TaxID=515981 RepID=UPI003519FFAF|nr:hypothetical protein FG386_001066 [Cryptosporidium ryanae]